MIDSLNYEGTDFCLPKSDLDPALLADLLDCGASGDASEAVDYVMSTWTVEGNPEQCAAYLRVYGAWDEDELSDHEENLRRLVWLTGCALSECMDEDGCEAYFSTY